MTQYRFDQNKFRGDNSKTAEGVVLLTSSGGLVDGSNPQGAAIDAFARARVSSPFTLFDSDNRYRENAKFFNSLTGAASITHDANKSMIILNTTTASGDSALRETNRVFAYQPGKSLLILSSFVFSPAKTNLRQRVGYFSTQNGIYLQLSGTELSIVLRSNVTGSVVETVVPQSTWNMDTLNGAGKSKITLDPSKAQLFFMDLEWLGVGSVRCGVFIDGIPIYFHSFHAANISTATYMTTAKLPGRFELTNIGAVVSPSAFGISCFAVISEGGYELRGSGISVQTPILTPKTLTTAGTYYPVISIRLKSSFLDAIVVPESISAFGNGTNAVLSYRLSVGGTLTGASFVSANANSSAEFDTSATAVSGGTVISTGFLATTNQSVQIANLFRDSFLKYQLERNSFTGTAVILTLEATSNVNSSTFYGTFNLEEI